MNLEEPHSTRGLNFFVTAITKHLNSSKISQFQILQINTNFSKLFKIYKIFTTNLFSKFATHLHQNFNPIYLFIYIYVSTTIHIPELKLVWTITFSFWYSQKFINVTLDLDFWLDNKIFHLNYHFSYLHYPDEKDEAGIERTEIPEYCDHGFHSCWHTRELEQAVCTVCPVTLVVLERVGGGNKVRLKLSGGGGWLLLYLLVNNE